MRTHLPALAIITLLSFAASAQITKGSILLGGDLGLSFGKTESAPFYKTEQNSYSFSPLVGVAVRENLVAGAFLISNRQKSWSDDLNFRNKEQTYGGGLFLRKYKKIGKEGFYLFAQGNAAVSYMKREELQSVTTSSVDTKRTSYSLSASPGISFAVSRRFHIETGFNNFLNLQYMTEKRLATTTSPLTVSESESQNFSFNTSLNNFNSNLYLGFRVLIGK